MKSRVFKPIFCIDCNIEFIPKSSGMKRCAKCQRLNDLKQGREYEAKKRGGYKLINQKQCKNCNTLFYPKSINAIYCAFCKPIKYFREGNSCNIYYKKCIVCDSLYIVGTRDLRKKCCSKKCSHEQHKLYLKTDRNQIQRRKLYRKENIKRLSDLGKKYRQKNKTKLKKQAQKRLKKYVIELADWYVKNQIVTSINRNVGVKLKTKDIPQFLIDEKREYLQMVRKYREQLK